MRETKKGKVGILITQFPPLTPLRNPLRRGNLGRCSPLAPEKQTLEAISCLSLLAPFLPFPRSSSIKEGQALRKVRFLLTFWDPDEDEMSPAFLHPSQFVELKSVH